MKSNYRPDLQGIRAVAVTMVLLFHFDMLGAVGGFAGVDVFFVLSGYLMTILLRQKNQDPALHLVATFLKRRFWRIAPAYYTIVLLTVIMSWLVYFPLDLIKIAESAFSTLPFLSNIYFKSQAG